MTANVIQALLAMVYVVVMVRMFYFSNQFFVLLCYFNIDINECIQSPCHPNAVCINTYGNFTCECKQNYIGNGFFCKSINAESKK